jgi:hypothetical protein
LDEILQTSVQVTDAFINLTDAYVD